MPAIRVSSTNTRQSCTINVFECGVDFRKSCWLVRSTCVLCCRFEKSRMVEEADEFTSLRRSSWWRPSSSARSSSWSRPSFWEPRVDKRMGRHRGEHQVKDGAPRNKLQASVNSRPSSWAHSSSWVRPSSWAPIGIVRAKGRR